MVDLLSARFAVRTVDWFRFRRASLSQEDVLTQRVAARAIVIKLLL